MTELTGSVLSVDLALAGSAVSEDYVADSFELAVYDVFDFAPDGGTVQIGTESYAYLSADWDASTLQLDPTAGNPTVALEDPVLVVPYAETKTALVDLGDEGDALLVTVPHALAALLDVGVREPDEAEAVQIGETEPGLWQVLNVLDRKAQVASDAVELPDTTDGLAPASSPTPTAYGFPGAINVRWSGIENADPVTYEVHVATFPDFDPDETTLAAVTNSISTTIRTLPNGDLLAYDTSYYFRVVATDADGAAEASDVATASMVKINSEDISAEFVYGGTVLAGQIIGGTVNADLTLSGLIKTADAGARVELGPFGFVVYDSNGDPTTLLGSDGLSTFRGQVQATTLDVTQGMSIRGLANEVAQGAEVSLAVGISASPSAPTVVTDYEVLAGWKTQSGLAWPAGYEFKNMHRLGTQWIVTAREVATDAVFVRSHNEDGTFGVWYGNGWTGQGVVRGVVPVAGQPALGFRNTDRKLVRATDSTNGGAAQNSLSWPLSSQPAGTTQVGDGSFSYSASPAFAQLTSGSFSTDTSLDANAAVDVRGRRISAKITEQGIEFNRPGQFIRLQLRNGTAGEYIRATIKGDTNRLELSTYNGTSGSTKTTSTTYNPTNHQWLRVIESNGDVWLQTSANGTTWSNTLTLTDCGFSDADLAAMVLSLRVNGGSESETVAAFSSVTIGWNFGDFGDTIPWLDTQNPPALGTDGTNVLAAEYDSANNRIKIYEIDPRSPGRIVATYTSGSHADFIGTVPLVSVAKGSFDFGGTRFVVGTGNSSGNQWAAVFSVSGTTLTYQPNESFYIPGQGGTGWDGTVFQTLATDGTRRKHTSIRWTSAGTGWGVDTYYASHTWYDGDSSGGTHETTPSPRASFSIRKRQRYTVTSAEIPDEGGVDDPDRIRVYLSTSAGGTQYLQATTAIGVRSAVLTAATFSGTIAPTTNTFPNAVAATITSPDGRLEISGDGTIRAGEFRGFGGGAASVLAVPYLGLMDIVGRTTTGGGVLACDATGVSWSQRFLLMGMGRHASYVSGGYFQIDMPANGTVIPRYNSAAGAGDTVTVASGKIPLAVWETLYYELPFGSGTASDPTKFRVVGYSTGNDFTVPWNWLPIVTRNAGTSGDSGAATFGTHRWINGRWTTVKDKVQGTWGLGTLHDVASAGAADVGLSQTIDVQGPESVFQVAICFDVERRSVQTNVSPDPLVLVGRLVVDGVTQGAQIITRMPTVNMRGTSSQFFTITGLAAGNREFKLQRSISGATTSGGTDGLGTGNTWTGGAGKLAYQYRINATHTNIQINQTV